MYYCYYYSDDDDNDDDDDDDDDDDWYCLNNNRHDWLTTKRRRHHNNSREKDRRDTRARPRGGEESGETIRATLEKVEQNREAEARGGCERVRGKRVRRGEEGSCGVDF